MMTERGMVDLIGVQFDGFGRQRGQSWAAQALRDAGLLAGVGEARTLPDVIGGPPTAERGPLGFVNESALLRMVDGVYETVRGSLWEGGFPLVHGGDCAVLVGALPALAETVDAPGLLFVDGHEDASTREAAEGEAANTEIAMLLGLHDDPSPSTWDSRLPALSAEALVLLGVRDEVERGNRGVPSIADRVATYTAREFCEQPDRSIAAALDRLDEQTDGWWLHIDLDVLDSREYAACGAASDPTMPGGLSWDHLALVASTALNAPECRGWSIGVYNTDLDPSGTEARRIVAFVNAAVRGRL
jgi:arginase